MAETRDNGYVYDKLMKKKTQTDGDTTGESNDRGLIESHRHSLL